MPRTTSCRRGEIVLVKFIFADEKGAKKRPGLIVSVEQYHQGRLEAILAAITSNVDRLLIGDHRIMEWQQAGLLFPSTITSIIRTIKQDMIVRKIGELRSSDLHAVESKLRDMLGL
jgi:mRNA-degrading endonuclease toxin of MazEF toxin-antitoxin module